MYNTNMKIKKEINERRASQIVDAINDPEKRKRLCVSNYFPVDPYRYLFNTEGQYIEARLTQLKKEGCFPFKRESK